MTTQIAAQNTHTMSSLEIAELTGKTHANVMRDIRTMLEALYPDNSEMNSQFEGTYQGERRTERCYNLPRRECEVLVTGYDVVRRAAVIDRWLELETAQRPMSSMEMIHHMSGEIIQQERRLAQQEERVSQVEQAVQSIETRMDNQGCDEGYMPRSEAFRHYGRGLSKSMFYLVISHDYFEVGTRPLTITTESFVNNTVQVNEEDVHAAITLFYEGLVQVTPTRYAHHLFGNRRFQA